MAKLFDFPPFPKTILVIDDEEMICMLLEKVVAMRGFDVRTALSAEEALPIIEAERIAGMLIDKNLPGIDGIELMRGVRMAQPDCACLIMTGYPSRDSAIEAVQLGAADYIAKPFTDVMLVANSLDRAVARSRFEYESKQIRAAMVALLAAAGDDAPAADASIAEVLNRGIEEIVGGLLAEVGSDLSSQEALERLLGRLRSGDGG